MISFFRKIRQKLLEENKIGNYLKYAIGEIVLVVVGILIALQINTWNENRKARTFETEILSLIDQNLTRDSVLIAAELQNAILAVQSTDSIFNQIERGIYDERLNVWMGKVVTFERFKSQPSAFEVLKSKGIETISDKELPLNLISYYDETLFRVYEALNDVENFFNVDWIPVIKNDFNDFSYRVRMEPRNPKVFFENPSSVVLFKLYKDNREQGSVRRMKTALDEISKLRTLIKKTESMISLFRKIRQKLLTENRVTKYLAYALGEILLVVIGILVALQVNTWNEERKSRKAETNFYAAILDDLEKDKAKIDQLNAFYSHRIKVLTWLLTRVRNPELAINGKEFGQNVEPLYYNETAISFDATFDASKSSGAFNQFKNKALLKQLIQYYSEFRMIEDVMTSTLRLIEDEFEPLMAPLPKNYLSGFSSNLVIAEEGNKFFYEHLGQVKDERNIHHDPVIMVFMQKPEFESYLVGDLGRAFHSIARLSNRLRQIEALQSEINLFLHD